MSKIKVLVIDDHPLVCLGVSALLSNHPSIECIHIAHNINKGIEANQTYYPELILLDVVFPDQSGLDFISILLKRRKPPKVIVFSAYENEYLVNKALDLGANGYLLKDSLPDELQSAITKVCLGEFYLSRIIGEKIALHSKGKIGNIQLASLTSRQLHLLQLVAAGHEVKDICEIVKKGERNIQGQIAMLRGLLGAKNNVELARIAIKNKLSII